MTASFRRALEDELAASPDDLATHAAYADLLDEIGDPRGELIQVQIALDDPSLADDPQPGLWPLVGADCLKNLRTFQVGEDAGDDHEDFHCTLITDAIVPLARTMPRLEELHVFARATNLSHLFTQQTLRQLRVLKL